MFHDRIKVLATRLGKRAINQYQIPLVKDLLNGIWPNKKVSLVMGKSVALT
jgi:hypothetical protein